MANLNDAAAVEKPLQVLAPACYSRLLTELETFHLHPYDVKAGAIAGDAGMTLVLRFGEDHAQVEERFFSAEALDRMGEDMTEFFRQAGKACKEALIAGYYNMMKM